MSDLDMSQKTAEPKGSNRNPSWAERNFASLVGGGVFALLAIITLVMYTVNN